MLILDVLSLLISVSTFRPISSSNSFEPRDSQLPLRIAFNSASAAECANVCWVRE